MTISNSVKAQLFALYFNQNVYHTDVWEDGATDILDITRLEFLISQTTDIAYLQLRSVSDLTDDEAVHVAKFQDLEYTDNVDIIGETKYKISKMWLNFLTADYLHSIGIALPFTYLNENNHPITLSVEELINLNWIKIK